MKWNSIGIRYETLRRKKSQIVVKDIEPKDWAKGSIEGGRKKLLRSHIWYIYLSSGSYDLQLSSYQKNFRNEVKWRQLNYTKYNLIGRWDKYFIGSKCIMTYWWPEWNYRIHEISVDQLIIICNYTDKSSYWNLRTNA